MTATNVDLFDLAERRMAWLNRRTALLADNIANADTPNFKPHDLQPFAATLAGATVVPLRTDPRHLASAASDGTAAAITRTDEHGLDGNAVRIDVEMTKLADTDTAQSLVGGLWQSYIGMFRTVLGK
jgi:flagellar basal-body rod protein FlgB